MAETNVNDTIQEQRERIQQLEERLDRLERERSQWLPRITDVLERMFPANVREHMKAARREQLLAARTWIDDMLASMDEGAAKGNPRRRIEVE